MTPLQVVLTAVVAPVTSLMIVLAGYIVQNQNLNARTAEIRSEIKDLLRAELSAVRAEMAKNQSELLAHFAELDRRLGQLEVRR